MLPAFPLDGGRVLRGILWQRTGDYERATTRAARVGRGFGYGMVGLGVLGVFAGAPGLLWLGLIGLFLIFAGKAEESNVALQSTFKGLGLRRVMAVPAATLEADTLVADALRDSFARLGYHAFPVVEGGVPVGPAGHRPGRGAARHRAGDDPRRRSRRPGSLGVRGRRRNRRPAARQPSLPAAWARGRSRPRWRNRDALGDSDPARRPGEAHARRPRARRADPSETGGLSAWTSVTTASSTSSRSTIADRSSSASASKAIRLPRTCSASPTASI